MTRGQKLLAFAPLAIVGAALFVFIGGQIVMRLWNWITPELFGFRTLTFWKALGLLALCRILFGSLSMNGGSRRRRVHGPRPNDKTGFRERIRERWGEGGAPEESGNA